MLVRLLIISFTCFWTVFATGEDRDGKLLPIFQIVRFPNDVCTVSGSKNGTCYTAEECSNKGGVNGGSCAEGFGVCCQFTLGCGSTSSENCTYFTLGTSDAVAGECRAKICKCSSDVCQLRLDFDTFMITGPATVTDSLSVIAAVGCPEGKKCALTTRCLTDTFSITNQDNLPQLCGTLTGDHVYVEACDACNSLDFQFGSTAQGVSAIVTRSINIKVTQISCFDKNKAPQGCDQWFYGNSGTGTVRTFNYANLYHLAAQEQNICIRRERGNCKICWSADAAADVKVSGKGASALPISSCCGYGSKATKTTGADCIIIPGATSTKGGVAPISQCGGSKGVYTATSKGAVGTTKTICSKSMPFMIEFLSDSFEFADASLEAKAAIGQQGFKLTYFQEAC